MAKKILFLVLILLLAGGSVYQLWKLRHSSLPNSATSPTSSTLQTGGKITVTASFYPLAEFAQHVGGDVVDVHNLTPPGAEPHDFEPSPQDLVLLQNSKVFIYNGAGLEIWLDKVSDDVKKKVVMVNASKGISLLQGDKVENQNQDPHVWMDPVLASQELENIKKGLIAADPKNSATYEQNAASYEKQLADLDASFRSGLAHCQNHILVTSHNAFQYLGKRYSLEVMSVSGLSPDEEPSPQKLAQVTQFVKQHDIKYIFFESLVSPKLSETIARETGAQTIAFNPLEGLTQEEIAQGRNYLTVQQANLSALRTALQCQ